jgi:geranylgeranyl diphosphate synthase, type II
LTPVAVFLEEKGAKTVEALERYFNRWDQSPESLRAAMRYTLFARCKRLRPALALGAAELFCGDDAVALPAACALEMIHTYSLIHDDLPAMDNDSLRRGIPTLHRAHGEAMAILAGDALMTMAFDIAAETNNMSLIHELAQAAGVEGMVGGQVIDLESEDKVLTLNALKALHARKTGALIRASVRSGAILAHAPSAQLASLSRYGEHIGLAFQIADDILDVAGSEKVLGKPIGSDAARHKSTYPALLGMVRTRELAHEAANEAVAALSGFGAEADMLRALARFIVERDT